MNDMTEAFQQKEVEAIALTGRQPLTKDDDYKSTSGHKRAKVSEDSIMQRLQLSNENMTLKINCKKMGIHAHCDDESDNESDEGDCDL